MAATLDQALVMNTTFAVEVEMTGITRSQAASVLARVLEVPFSAIHHRGGSYDKYIVTDSQGREWEFQSDASIYTTGGRETSCEMATPPLTYTADMETLQNVISDLKVAGAISSAERNCGIHVHVSAAGHTAATLKNLIYMFYSQDELFRKAFGVSDDRLEWCQPMDEAIVENVKKAKTIDDVKKIWYRTFHGEHIDSDVCCERHYDNSRYHILNLHRLFMSGTDYEIRAFNGELNSEKIRTYVLLALSINAAALTWKGIRAQKNPTMIAGNEKFAMRTLLNRMGWTGDTYRIPHALAIANLNGDSAWRFGKNKDQYLG